MSESSITRLPASNGHPPSPKSGSEELSSHELIEQYLQSKQFAIREITARSYRRQLMVLRNAFQERSLLELGKVDILLFLRQLKQTNPDLAPVTLKSYVHNIGAFYRWLIDEHHYRSQVPPTYGIRIPVHWEPQTQPLVQQELSRLEQIIASPMFSHMERAICWVVMSTSLRRSEIPRLRKDPKSLNLAHRLIYVPKEWTKTGRTSKIVPLTTQAVNAIKSWLVIDPQPECPWLFHTSKGTPIHPNVISVLMQTVISLGHPQNWTKTYGAHQFRHTFATQWVEAGCDPIALMKIMGWTSLSPEMIQRYVRVSAPFIQRWVNEFHRRRKSYPRGTHQDQMQELLESLKKQMENVQRQLGHLAQAKTV